MFVPVARRQLDDTAAPLLQDRRDFLRTPGSMTDNRRFDELLAEFERVGVDLDSFPAGIDVQRDDAMRILRALPDGAGPAAFLARVREEQLTRTPPRGTVRQSAEDRESA